MVLVFDIETWVKGLRDRPDPNKDILRFFGAFDMNTKKEYFFTYKDEDKVKALLKKHNVIVTFNGKGYDIPILERHRLINGYHLSIDLLEIARKREDVMGLLNKSKSLSNLAKIFKLKHAKDDDFDYDILKKDDWTKEELAYIKKYTMNDIYLTVELLEYMADYFACFKEFLSKDDVRTYKWLTCSLSVFGYKVVCNKAGIKEEYAQNVTKQTYPGGFVMMPIQERADGDIYLLDFNSLYPHNNIQGNLFSWRCKCCREEEKWSGNEMFPLKGKYCMKKQGKIENAIQEIYNLRVKYKKIKDRREYALKIVMNILYGLTGNPVFRNLYNYNTAYDCTLIGRNSIHFAIKRFQQAGYKVLYGDTDSAFILDLYNDKERFLMVKDGIIKKIKDNLIFPADTFDMGIDAKIKHIFFFKNSDGTFKKKNYVYVTDDNEVEVKGLPIKKSDGSGLGLIIFKKYLIKDIINGTITFKFSDINAYIEKEINENPECVARSFNVGEVDSYASPNCLPAQISKKYGPGRHMLIPNKYIGAGKSTKYCTIAEYKENEFKSGSLILNKLWSELEVFLNYVPKQVKCGKPSPQTELLRWAGL